MTNEIEQHVGRLDVRLSVCQRGNRVVSGEQKGMVGWWDESDERCPADFIPISMVTGDRERDSLAGLPSNTGDMSQHPSFGAGMKGASLKTS